MAPTSNQQDSTKGLKKVILGVLAGILVLAAGIGVLSYLGNRPVTTPSNEEQALVAAEAAVRANPNDLPARLTLAQAYTRVSPPRLEDSQTQLAEILRVDPTNRQALLGSGMVAYQQGDLKMSEQRLTAFVKNSGEGEFATADPQLEEAFYYLGVINQRNGNNPEAITNFQSALHIDRTDSDAWFNLGQAQLGQKSYQEAADAFSNALTFVPTGWCDPYDGLLKAYTGLDDKDGVAFSTVMLGVCNNDPSVDIKQLEALASGPYKIPALLALGASAEKTGDYAKAHDWFTQVTAVDPKNVAALTALARLDTPTDAAHTQGQENSK